MVFNSYFFLLIYLPLVLAGFYTFARLHLTHAARGWLLVSSLFFYACWDIRYLPLLAASIVFNYGTGVQILKSQTLTRKKFFLVTGIFINLILLFYFKYSHFFFSHLLETSQWAEVILPLGISFFTFTQIAYLVDAYQGKAEKTGLISYGLFVTIFPHMIAGPILHHREMISQFHHPRIFVVSWTNVARGIFLFCIGLCKKVIIADYLATFVKPIFDGNTDPVSFLPAWLSALSYTLQLYFDFSGYSDMAIGLGLFFSIHLPINFNSPYQADCIIDFWKRWHITLSQFLRDYLYITLGGNRNGKWAKLRNLFVTMLLGGIWHGAGWTYILWGVCHGLFLIVNHLWRDFKLTMPSYLSKALTLIAIICAWVIFRAPNIEQAFNILKGMWGFNGIILPERYAHLLALLQPWGVTFATIPHSTFTLLPIAILGLLSVVVLLFPNSQYWADKFQQRPKPWAIPCALSIFLMCVIYFDEVQEFIYYQF